MLYYIIAAAIDCRPRVREDRVVFGGSEPSRRTPACLRNSICLQQNMTHI